MVSTDPILNSWVNSSLRKSFFWPKLCYYTWNPQKWDFLKKCEKSKVFWTWSSQNPYQCETLYIGSLSLKFQPKKRRAFWELRILSGAPFSLKMPNNTLKMVFLAFFSISKRRDQCYGRFGTFWGPKNLFLMPKNTKKQIWIFLAIFKGRNDFLTQK